MEIHSPKVKMASGKKPAVDIIFVKHFRPHLGLCCNLLFKKIFPFFFFWPGMVSGMAMSRWDGQLVCTASEDQSVKVFDVVNFGVCIDPAHHCPAFISVFHIKFEGIAA